MKLIKLVLVSAVAVGYLAASIEYPIHFVPPQYKDRVDMKLIKPAVDWRKAGVADATNKAAVAAQQ